METLSVEEVKLLQLLEEQNKAILEHSKPNTVKKEILSVEEAKLLQLLEEQNKAILEDPKSIACFSLPNQPSSSCDPPSKAAFESCDGDDVLKHWQDIKANWDQCFTRKRSQLESDMRKGIPDQLREFMWANYTQANDSPLRHAYAAYLTSESPVERSIQRDVSRTFPTHDFFKDETGQNKLFRAMKAYSLHDPEVGYCQGSNFIMGLLLIHLKEDVAFTVFVYILSKLHLRTMFLPSMYELDLCLYQLDQLVRERLPELHSHFLVNNFRPPVYASGWFLTLYASFLPFDTAKRVIDIFLVDGIPSLFRIALAILTLCADELINTSLDAMTTYMQKVSRTKFQTNPDLLFDTAAKIRIDSRKMKRYASKYLTMRGKELDDQMELSRLRTENTYLRKQIHRLEKECHETATILVDTQVNRAEESEQMLALRRQLTNLQQRHNLMTSTSDSNDQSSTVEHSDSSNNQLEDDDQSSLATPPSLPADAATVDGQHQFYKHSSGGASSLWPRGDSPRQHQPQQPDDNDSLHNGLVSSSSDLGSSDLGTAVEYVPASNGGGGHPLKQSTCPNDDDLQSRSRLRVVENQLALTRLNEASVRQELVDARMRFDQLSKESSARISELTDQVDRLNDELLQVKLMSTTTIDSTAPESTLDDAISPNLPSSSSYSTAAKIDRLEQKCRELSESLTAANLQSDSLMLEVKRLTQSIVDIETQRKSDQLSWQSRELDLLTQFTDQRQQRFDAEQSYQFLLAQQLISRQQQQQSVDDFKQQLDNSDQTTLLLNGGDDDQS